MLGVIGVDDEYKGLLAQIRDEGKTKWINEGKLEGKRDIINTMLKKFSIDTVCDLLDMKRSEVEDILGD